MATLPLLIGSYCPSFKRCGKTKFLAAPNYLDAHHTLSLKTEMEGGVAVTGRPLQL